MKAHYKTLSYDVPVIITEMAPNPTFAKVQLDWSGILEQNLSAREDSDILAQFLDHVSTHMLSEDEFEGNPWDYAHDEFIVWAKFLKIREDSDLTKPESAQEPALKQEALDSINLLCDSGMDITNVIASIDKEHGRLTIQFKRKK